MFLTIKKYAFVAALATATAFGATSAAVAGGHGMKGDAYGAKKDSAMMKKDIVDTAATAGQFNTLVAAVKAAGLVETLKGDGPFTVFAPTDEAFAKLPAGTVEDLLKPENRDQLIAVLTYHVVPGKVMSSDIAGKMVEPATVQGSTLSVDATSGVKVDNASVVQADIVTSNGVIHVIDSVVLPN